MHNRAQCNLFSSAREELLSIVPSHSRAFSPVSGTLAGFVIASISPQESTSVPQSMTPISRDSFTDPLSRRDSAEKNRVAFLNQLIREYRFQSYLEIGCGDDQAFALVDVGDKVGVDPVRGGTLRMTSDRFFQVNRKQFDLIFIDGLHLQEQVLRDVSNSLRALRAGGVIVLHDCLPRTEAQQQRIRNRRAWTGDVWKAVVSLRTDPNLDVAVADADWGLGIVVRRSNSEQLLLASQPAWIDYERERARLLRIIDYRAAIDFVRRSPVGSPVADSRTDPG